MTVLNLPPHQHDMLDNIRVFAIRYGIPVEVDTDTVNAGHVDVIGDFGQRWTHGGYAPVTHRRVLITSLTALELK